MKWLRVYLDPPEWDASSSQGNVTVIFRKFWSLWRGRTTRKWRKIWQYCALSKLRILIVENDSKCGKLQYRLPKMQYWVFQKQSRLEVTYPFQKWGDIGLDMLHRRANNNCKVVLRWVSERKIDTGHSKSTWWKNRNKKQWQNRKEKQ